MWGFFYGSITGYGSDTTFILSEGPSQYTTPIFFSGFIPGSMILIGSIMLISSSDTAKTGRRDIKNVENGWIGIGIMMIVAALIFIIGIDITMINWMKYILEQELGYIPHLRDFWDAFNPGFAVIAPFIGAGLSIAGSIASKIIKSREEPIIIGEKKGIKTIKPIGEESPQIKFCSDCGHRILPSGSKFCTNCGKEIIY
ncbi:MAG: zinc ribbon domain-containing protein [Candidatus Thorarchaeota archaeon]